MNITVLINPDILREFFYCFGLKILRPAITDFNLSDNSLILLNQYFLIENKEGAGGFMKLPWDKNYIKFSFHIVVTVVIIYALKLCVDFLAYIITNLGEIYTGLGNFFDWLFSVCATLVIAFIISYVLDPAVDFFQNKYDIISKRYIMAQIKKSKSFKEFLIKLHIKKKLRTKKNEVVYKKRTAGTLITFLIIILLIYFGINFLIGKISESGGDNIIDSIIAFVNSSFSDFSKLYDNMEKILKNYGVFEYAEQYINSFTKELTAFVSNIGTGIVDFIYSFASGFLNILIGFVIAFYFLRDKESIKHKFQEIFKAFFPPKFNTVLQNVASDINAVFSGYIRGQIIDASIMSVLISTGLMLIDVNFAVIIGIISGFANIIPYFGAFMAFILAMIVTLLSGEPIKALYAAIVITVLQQLDGIVIGPKVVGENVKLSPVMVIIALAVAAELFGLWGMVLAIPVFATIKLFAQRFFYRQKLKKEHLFTENHN